MLRIKEIRKSRGLTQAKVAEELGLHLTNYNNLENGKADITLSRLDQLAQIFHCQPTDLISPSHNIRTVIVKQHAEAGAWAESNEWDQDDWYEVAVPDDPAFRRFNLYGAEARGPSMNKRYPEGSALIFTSLVETKEQLLIGKRYIVEIERPDGLREATVKKLWQDEVGKYWLLPESNDPRFQNPIALDGTEGDMIRIVGRIIYSVQREG